MALYTFYPCKTDGTSETFTCFDLRDDDEACDRALKVLDDHDGCSQVVVWAGNRRVTSRNRMERDPPPSLLPEERPTAAERADLARKLLRKMVGDDPNIARRVRDLDIDLRR